MAFPTNPTDGQIYNNYYYDTSKQAWVRYPIKDLTIESLSTKIIEQEAISSILIPSNTDTWVKLLETSWNANIEFNMKEHGTNSSVSLKVSLVSGMFLYPSLFEVSGGGYQNRLDYIRVSSITNDWDSNTEVWTHIISHPYDLRIDVYPIVVQSSTDFTPSLGTPPSTTRKEYQLPTDNSRIYFNN